MDITIRSVKFNATTQLEAFVEQKVKKLDVFFDGVIGTEVALKLDKAESAGNKIAEINLKVPGDDLFVKKQAKTFEEAVDMSCEVLRRQLIKYKEKVKSK